MGHKRKWAWAVVMLGWLFYATGCGLFVKLIPPGEILSRTPKDCFIEISGVRYHYTEYPGKGPVVVLLHGFASSTYTWEKVAPYLNEAGYHVLALDMKGFGWSDKPKDAKYDPYTLMHEVNQWMDALGLKDVTFVGNSLGGAIAWLMALEHPDKVGRLVLIDAAGYPMAKPFIIRMAGAPLSGIVAKLFFCRLIVKWNLKKVYDHEDWITEEQVNAYYNRLRTENALDAQIAVVRSLKVDLFEKYIKRIPTIDKKTLIIWGRNDRWIPLEEVGYKFRRDLSNSRLVVIPECGHIPQEEHPEKCARLILDFIGDKPIGDSPRPPNS
jgi:pimeloyl-ACP methyl ester carboxylesterase